MSASQKALRIVSEQKVFIGIIIIGGLLTIRTSYFLSIGNLLSILLAMSIDGLLAIGLSYVVIAGEIDLSIGATLSLSATFAILFQKYGLVPGIISGLVIGTAVGLVNGLVVTRLRAPSIAATVGMMIMLTGLVFVITKKDSIRGVNESFELLTTPELAGIPIMIIIFIVCVIIFHFLLNSTLFGRNIFACGGNPRASEYSGINVRNTKLIAFLICGALCGFAGVMFASRNNVASGLIGKYTPLYVITAVLLGGISLSGGEGSVFKAFQGILFVSFLENVMIILKFPTATKSIVVGCLLIGVLIIDAIKVEKEKYA